MTTQFIAHLRDLMESRAPDYAVAVGPQTKTVVWAEFYEAVRRQTAALEAFSADRIGVYFEDVFDFAVAFMAVLHAGKTPILLPHLKPEFLTRLNRNLDALLTDQGQVDCPIPFAPIAADVTSVPDLPKMPADAVIYLCTSGSTGAPTLIEKPLQCLESEVGVQHKTFNWLNSNAPIAASVSHQHIYGLLFRVLLPLMKGQLIWRPMIRYPEDVALLPDDSLLISSPAFLKRAVTLPAFTSEAARLGACISSGGALPETVAQLRPIEIFGSTETGGIAWRHVSDSDTPEQWTFFKGVEAVVVDGCLALTSPFIPGEELYQTNDRVRLIGGDRMELLGRADRIVKIEEKRISLTAVEQVLLSHDLLSEVAVLMLPNDSRTGLGAIVVPNEKGWDFLSQNGRRALVSLLGEELRRHIEDIAVPRRWRFVQTLPANSQGKALADDLKALFAAGAHHRPTAQHVECVGDAASLTLDVGEDVYYFKGHFPEQPILPGVAQLTWAAQFADEFFSIGQAFARIEALKFQQVITPGMNVTLALTHNPEKASVTFVFSSKEGRHSTGRLVYGGAHGA